MKKSLTMLKKTIPDWKLFNEPVATEDYAQYVSTPMDLRTITCAKSPLFSKAVSTKNQLCAC